MDINQIQRWADTVTDKAGQPIEPGIKKVVIYLNALGIETSMSCEGHYDGTGLPMPWVSFYGNIPADETTGEERENWWHDTKLYNQIANRGKYLRRKLKGYLREFYVHQPGDEELRLVIISEYYGYRLVNARYSQFVADYMHKGNNTGANLKEKTLAYRSEFDAFADFLQKEYSKNK